MASRKDARPGDSVTLAGKDMLMDDQGYGAGGGRGREKSRSRSRTAVGFGLAGTKLHGRYKRIESANGRHCTTILPTIHGYLAYPCSCLPT